MTTISDRTQTTIYGEDDREYRIEVDIEAQALYREQREDALEAVERVRQAVRDECDAIQEALEGGGDAA